MENTNNAFHSSPTFPRVLPFACFMAFIAVQGLFSSGGIFESEQVIFWLYPMRALLVAGVLISCFRSYSELKEKPFAGIGELTLSVGVGVLVYLAWFQMDWPWAIQGEGAAGYNPFEEEGSTGYILAAVRLISVSVVVPIMEEIFWRSFLIRYIISADFISVPLGKHTTPSFLISVALFGAEHHLWVAGLMAGAVYNLLLYKTRRIWPCIFAHGVTNFLLGVHVLVTEDWVWW